MFYFISKEWNASFSGLIMFLTILTLRPLSKRLAKQTFSFLSLIHRLYDMVRG